MHREISFRGVALMRRFGAAGGGGGAPSDPVILLDASDNSTLLNASGDPAAGDENVHTWVNKGTWGSDGDGTNSGEIIDPVRKVAILNGKDVLRFIPEGDESGLVHRLPVGKRFDRQNHTMVCVFKLNQEVGSTDFNWLFNQSDGSDGAKKIDLGLRGSDQKWRYAVSNDDGTSEQGAVGGDLDELLNSPRIFAVRCVDGEMTAWLDGVQVTSASHAFTGDSGDQGGINVRTNSSLTFSGRTFGDHAEIRMWDEALTDSQLSSVISELQDKWINAYEIPAALDITGLSLWLDGSDETSMFDAEEGGSNVAADGAIARWEDKSNNFRHAKQGTAAARPIRKTAEQNGNDVVRFDGLDDIMQSRLTFDIHNASMFVVCRLRDAAGDSSVSRTVAPGSTDHRWYVFTWRTFKGASQLTHTDDTNWKLVGLLGSSTQHINRHNGVEQTAADANEATTESTYIGGGNTVPADDEVDVFGEVDIAEVVVYNRVLSTAEREQVETFLQNKWATPALP